MSKYRYETWKNILTKLEVGREYSVDNTRPDYDQFVDALKTFAANWWNFVVKDHGESITFVMLDPIRCVQEMIDLYEEKGHPKPEEVKRGDSYTKSHNPENMEAKKKEWETRNAEAKAREALRVAQANDLPTSGVSGHSEKDNAVSVIKIAKNENDKSNENTEW